MIINNISFLNIVAFYKNFEIWTFDTQNIDFEQLRNLIVFSLEYFKHSFVRIYSFEDFLILFGDFYKTDYIL